MARTPSTALQTPSAKSARLPHSAPRSAPAASRRKALAAALAQLNDALAPLPISAELSLRVSVRSTALTLLVQADGSQCVSVRELREGEQMVSSAIIEVDSLATFRTLATDGKYA